MGDENKPFEYGPVQTYEVTWRSGHISTVLAHQVTWPQRGLAMVAGSTLTLAQQQGRERIHFHASINGKWLLTLAADEEDLLGVRLVLEPEALPAPDGSS